MRHFYRIVATDGGRGWEVLTAAYYYSIWDRAGREILAYHWHPDVPDVAFPHLHISPGAVASDLLARAGASTAHNGLWPPLAGAHLPTGFTSLHTFLWLAVAQLGVQPRRAEWREILVPPAV